MAFGPAPALWMATIGLFDPSMVTADQTHTITYAFQDGACDNSGTVAIEVVSSATATIEELIICTDSEPQQLVVDQDGGTWSGPSGTTPEGLFDPANLPADANYVVNYQFTDNNGCEVSAAGNVFIESLPLLNKLDTIALCLADFSLNIAESSKL